MSNPKPESKVQVRDLLQVEWSGEQWEKLVALLGRKAPSLGKASNQTNSPEPLGTAALKSQTPSGPEGSPYETLESLEPGPPEGFSVEEWEEVLRLY